MGFLVPSCSFHNGKNLLFLMLQPSDLKPGNTIKHQNSLWEVISTQHVKPGKGGAFAQVELKNIINGTKLNERFRSQDKIEGVTFDEQTATFSYSDQTQATFMNNETYESVEIPLERFTPEHRKILKDGMVVALRFYEERLIDVSLPEKVEVELAYAEPVVKGQTATSSYKRAQTTQGLEILVPPHIEAGQKIIIRTHDLAYVSKA